MRNAEVKRIALGGMLAATALVIMCLGGIIPVATYVCPMLCAVLQFLVFKFCGKRIGWAWYAGVAVLSLLLGPDKEGAMVFVALGYYPMVKPALERSKLGLLWKMLLFNGVIALLYGFILSLMGIEASETDGWGLAGLALLLVMGNCVFFLLDRLLTIMEKKTWKK